MGKTHSEQYSAPTSSPVRVSRRQLLATSPAALLGVMSGAVDSAQLAGQFTMLAPIEPIANPLVTYPDRGWERR